MLKFKNRKGDRRGGRTQLQNTEKSAPTSVTIGATKREKKWDASNLGDYKKNSQNSETQALGVTGQKDRERPPPCRRTTQTKQLLLNEKKRCANIAVRRWNEKGPLRSTAERKDKGGESDKLGTLLASARAEGKSVELGGRETKKD